MYITPRHVTVVQKFVATHVQGYTTRNKSEEAAAMEVRGYTSPHLTFDVALYIKALTLGANTRSLNY